MLSPNQKKVLCGHDVLDPRRMSGDGFEKDHCDHEARWNGWIASDSRWKYMDKVINSGVLLAALPSTIEWKEAASSLHANSMSSASSMILKCYTICERSESVNQRSYSSSDTVLDHRSARLARSARPCLWCLVLVIVARGMFGKNWS